MTSYKNLIVWKKSIELVKEVYTISNLLPKEEVYGLTSQIRRSSVSIPSNIAEGNYFYSNKAKKRYFRIAFGSAAELETQLIILKKIEYLKDSDLQKAETLLLEVLKMLNSLVKSL